MIPRRSFQAPAITFLFLALSSCATYRMSREQLFAQIYNATPESATTRHSAMIGTQRYTTNGVKEIRCYDKHGSQCVLANSPRLEMRITCNNGKKRLFYFDTILLEDSVFSGCNSRILGTRKSVKYNDIKTVELQDGRKAYYYAQ